MGSVRCVLCGDVYCVDAECDGIGCVSVPPFAKDWLCIHCLQKVIRQPTKHEPHIQAICNSPMNVCIVTLSFNIVHVLTCLMQRSYQIRTPELPGFRGAILQPLLVLQVSCNTEGESPSITVAERLWGHLEQVYKTIGPHMVGPKSVDWHGY